LRDITLSEISSSYLCTAETRSRHYGDSLLYPLRGWRVGRSLAPRERVADFGIGMPGADGIIAGRTAVPPTIAGAGPQLFLSHSRLSSYHQCMTKLLEQAIEAVRRLPADSQDDIARTILHLAGSEVEAEPVDPAHLAAVLEGLAQAKRREFATDDCFPPL